jgi:hypothetical protein
MVSPMHARLKILVQAFEYANEYVLETTDCMEVERISNGWCDVWARAVKRKAGFVEVRQWYGHWFVVYEGVAYDSDTTEHGFAPSE